jgi:hypothetical protein
LQPNSSASGQGQGLSTDQLTELLVLVSLLHDIGGVLVPEQVELERNILELLSNVSALDWAGALDTRIVEVMIRQFSERALTAREQEALKRFNDDVQSAIFATELEQIADHDHRDAIIWIVANQEYAHSFEHLPRSLGISYAELARIFACLKVADAICYSHTLWKPRVKPVSGDFASSLLYFAEHVGPCLSQPMSPGVYIDAVNNLLLEPAGQGISLLDYVRRELHYKLDGERREFVDLPASDRVYLELLWDGEEVAGHWDTQQIVAPLVATLAAATPGSPSRDLRDELELLAMLPERLDCLWDHGVTTIAPGDTISELAQAINAALVNHGMLTAVPLPARDSLLRMLGYGRRRSLH